MQNRLYNGEMQAKNPAGLPPQVPERLVPREAVPEQDWWLRSNDRSKLRCDPSFTYYPQNTLQKRHFQAGAIEKDHSRRVFKELARQGHSFSEANLQALKQDREIRKAMQKRYWEVMGAPSGPPGPTKNFLRQPGETPVSKSVDSGPVAEKRRDDPPCSFAERAASVVSASVVAPSRVSAAAMSRTGSMAALSRAASVPPVGGEPGAVADQGVMSGVGVSQLSQSDFYAWRPRMLR